MSFIGLLTAFGVFMHDGRVDRAAITAMNRPFESMQVSRELAQRVKAFVETDSHTHPDRNAARSLLTNSFTYQSPSIPPRKKQHHLIDEHFGRHAFDNANLPIID